ncbi:hypothetical protein [Marinifilum sp.]
MKSNNSLEFRRRWFRNLNNNNLKETFFIDINNKWLCLTGVALFWET